MSEDLKDDALYATYRQASEAEAGRAPSAVRAAILAEARAAAERRRPAANDARYWMSAVAGIAVVSIGVVLWRQTGDELQVPGAAPQSITVRIEEQPAPQMEVQVPPVMVEMPPPPAASEAAPAEAVADAVKAAPAPATSAREDSDAQQAFGNSVAQEREQSAARTPAVPESAQASVEPAEEPRSPAPPAPPPPPSLPPPPPTALRAPSSAEVLSEPRARAAEADQSAEFEEVQVTGTRILRPADPMELLRREFPDQYRSGSNHRLWLVLDAGGAVRMKGELRAGQQLEDLAPQLARELGSAAGSWQVERLENSRARVIELGIARLP